MIQIHQLERQIGQIKKKIATIGDLRPGSLSEQYNVCGTKGCRCKASPPQKHGPYYQLSYTRKRKSYSRFITKRHVGAVKHQMQAYTKLRSLVDEWIDLSIQVCELKLREDCA